MILNEESKWALQKELNFYETMPYVESGSWMILGLKDKHGRWGGLGGSK